MKVSGRVMPLYNLPVAIDAVLSLFCPQLCFFCPQSPTRYQRGGDFVLGASISLLYTPQYRLLGLDEVMIARMTGSEPLLAFLQSVGFW
jgi:hypothetical protein